MILVVDNYDSFTWNLVDYIARTGEKVTLVRNDIDPETWDFKSIKGIVLSPGPGRPSEAGFLLQIIEKFENKLPILGICLGHQAIGEHFGATLINAPFPMHGKLSKIQCNTENPLFNGFLPYLNVVRYHSLVLSDIKLPLKIIANTDNIAMSICHSEKPIYGIQFHPEAYLTEKGFEIIENWVKICNHFQVELI